MMVVLAWETAAWISLNNSTINKRLRFSFSRSSETIDPKPRFHVFGGTGGHQLPLPCSNGYV